MERALETGEKTAGAEEAGGKVRANGKGPLPKTCMSVLSRSVYEGSFGETSSSFYAYTPLSSHLGRSLRRASDSSPCRRAPRAHVPPASAALSLSLLQLVPQT